jgi:predicted acetyltransferase
VLTASEGAIYGRFGYGLATFYATAELPTKGTELLRPPCCGGRIRLVDSETAAKLLPEIWETTRLTRPGSLTRNPAFWESYFTDLAAWRDGATARYYAVHEGTDGPDGYIAYRRKTGDDENRILLGLMHTTDPEVEAAFLRYLLDIDLARRLTLQWRPLDDHLRWRMASNDWYTTKQVADWLWVRLLDIPSALTARTYSTAGKIVLDVHDHFRPANSGRYRLEADPSGSVVVRLSADENAADLTLEVDALGAAYLGGVAFTTLAAAGRAAGDRAALRRADALFRTPALPFCDLSF